ncbi:hypothetical protein ACFL0B_00005 [Thermodesulfobacteriota bacterium]
MAFTIDINHRLFDKLSEEQPVWWRNLISDPQIYIDIRKGNHINVYFNGGSIMKLECPRAYKAQIHFEYIPLKRESNYLPLSFSENEISIPVIEPISLNNFNTNSLEKIKKRIAKFYPNNSEKGIQGKYVTANNNKRKSDGFFIDTEFQFTFNEEKESKKGRVDLVWIDLKRKEIVLVELKTIGDGRLYNEDCHDPESVDVQLDKYRRFAMIYEEMLKEYYDTVFQIKNKLKVLPSFVTETSLLKYKLVNKPILLVGDCTRLWIKDNSKNLNDKIDSVAHSCIYQGINTFTFNIPQKSMRNSFVF